MIRKNVLQDGRKIADKNWVLSAYNRNGADGGMSAITSTNQAQAARGTHVSGDKGNNNSSAGQGIHEAQESYKPMDGQPVAYTHSGGWEAFLGLAPLLLSAHSRFRTHCLSCLQTPNAQIPRCSFGQTHALSLSFIQLFGLHLR